MPSYSIAEASTRLKEASVKKRHEAFDAAVVTRASRCVVVCGREEERKFLFMDGLIDSITIQPMRVACRAP